VKLDRVLQYSQAYNFFQWVFGRHAPEPGVVFLSQRRVYILPTRHGLSFRGCRDPDADRLDQLQPLPRLLCSRSCSRAWGIVSILHTFQNLAHLYVSAGRVAPVFAGTRRSSSSYSRTRATSIAIRSISPAAGPG